MAQSKEEAETRGFARLILDAQQQMDQARTLYYQELAENGVTGETRAHLHSSLLRYYSILRRYRTENQAADAWEEHDLDALGDVLRQQEVVKQKRPGWGTGVEEVVRPRRINPEDAIEVSFTLDDVAKDLGFAAASTESTPRTEITKDDLKEVEEWRQQNLDQ